ncbi:MAG: DUF2232 domain-containing protein [Bradyrhizobiaceae bacterium]|nr:DUF2232 domain-containing protein [Bradyrhizobiaceae bacterium]
MVQILLIGFGAGLTSALLFASLATGSAYSVALFYLTPLPILLAGIAWNHLAGAIAALTAAILLGAFLGLWFVLAFLIGIGAPSYVLAYLALLARPAEAKEGETQALEWYPPGRIVIAASLMAATATALSIPAFGFDAESYRGALRSAFERVLRAQTGTPADQPLTLPGNTDAAALLDLLVIAMPPAAAALNFVTLLFNTWLAGRIARTSGRLARPWPDLGALRFPKQAPTLLAVAIAGTFLPGLGGIVAGFFSATLFLAYAVLGLAVIHGASRALPARQFLLTGVWLAVFLLGWPLLLIAMLGLADAMIDIRARVAGGPKNLPTNRPNE